MDSTVVIELREQRLPRVSIGWSERSWLVCDVSDTPPHADQIIAFLSGEGRDPAGRSHAAILAFDDERLENTHDYIQWLFPLTTPSAAVPGSPVLTAATVAGARTNARVQHRLRLAARRMLAFLGRTDGWLSPFDHNQLRITRIIKSLRLLSGDQDANAFRGQVIAMVAARGVQLDPHTLEFWAAA